MTASHTIFCIHQSVTMTCQMTKTYVDQCSLHGCANVSLWLRVGNPISAFQSDKRYFTKDEHWGAFQSSSAISTSVWLKWVLTNWNYLCWYKIKLIWCKLLLIDYKNWLIDIDIKTKSITISWCTLYLRLLFDDVCRSVYIRVILRLRKQRLKKSDRKTATHSQ